MKKFEKSDVFFNVIRANPKSSFFIYDGKVYHANSTEQSLQLNTFLAARPIIEETGEPYPAFGPAALTESYETAEGWGQLVDPTAYPTFGATALTESYETAEGWL